MFDIMGMVYGVLNAIFNPILAMDPNPSNPALTVLIIAFIVSLITTVANKYLVDQDALNEKQLKTILNNIFQTHNLVNIQQVKGIDLQITETDFYDYILTYSFPCQDLSLAGKGKGMSNTSTRSGM